MRASPTVIAMAIALCHATAAFADDDLAARIGDSREAIKSFAGALQEQLMSAMAAGGPTAAIEVCKIVAPDIAAEASEERGWRIGRTSLKLRNPANAPDAWELAVLRDFEARSAAGEDPAGIDQDGRGRLIVVDYGNHRAQIFDGEGKWLVTFGAGRT